MAPTAAMATILVREGIFDTIRMVLSCMVLSCLVVIYSREVERCPVPLSQPCRCGGGTARDDDVVIKVQRLLLCSNLASASLRHAPTQSQEGGWGVERRTILDIEKPPLKKD